MTDRAVRMGYTVCARLRPLLPSTHAEPDEHEQIRNRPHAAHKPRLSRVETYINGNGVVGGGGE